MSREIIPIPIDPADVELALGAAEALDTSSAPEEQISAVAVEVAHAAELDRMIDSDQINADDCNYQERVRSRNAAVRAHLLLKPSIGTEPDEGFIEPIGDADYQPAPAPKPASSFQVIRKRKCR
jgi:hypothetical protein